MCNKWVGILLALHIEPKCHFYQFFLAHLNLKENVIWKGLGYLLFGIFGRREVK